MCNAILFRNSSEESEETMKILNDSSFDFTEVFSLSEGERPTLMIHNNVYPFKGIDRIKTYIDSKKEKGKEN